MTRHSQHQASLASTLGLMGALSVAATAGLLAVGNHGALCRPESYTAYRQQALVICSSITTALAAIPGPALYGLRKAVISNNSSLMTSRALIMGCQTSMSAGQNAYTPKSGLFASLEAEERRCQDILLQQVHLACAGFLFLIWFFGIVLIPVFTFDIVCAGSQLGLDKHRLQQGLLKGLVTISILSVAVLCAILALW
jgi:hypothetical protein